MSAASCKNSSSSKSYISLFLDKESFEDSLSLNIGWILLPSGESSAFDNTELFKAIYVLFRMLYVESYSLR